VWHAVSRQVKQLELPRVAAQELRLVCVLVLSSVSWLVWRLAWRAES